MDAEKQTKTIAWDVLRRWDSEYGQKYLTELADIISDALLAFRDEGLDQAADKLRDMQKDRYGFPAELSALVEAENIVRELKHGGKDYTDED